MKILILNHIEVQQLLPMSECIGVMEEALAALARAEAHQPLRTIVRPEDVYGVMALMPAYRGGDNAMFGLKAICVFPGNAEIGKDAHQGGVLLFSGQTGELLAVVNASAITAIRTAAVSAAATKLLARKDAGELAIIGAGVQARVHLEAIACVLSLKRGRIAARRVENAAALATEMQPRFSFPLVPVQNAEAATRDADIIVTATTSREPVLRREWISPGAHVNAVGTYAPTAREIDTQTMAEASLFVDRRESALNEAGDYLIAAQEGAIGPDHIRGELGELLVGASPGRTASYEITIFKSLGLAIEDLAAAAHTYQKARDKSRGRWVEFD